MSTNQKKIVAEGNHSQCPTLPETKKDPSLRTKVGITSLWSQRMLKDEQSLFFKITFIGPPNSGKSSIIRQYIYNTFEYEYTATLGMQNFNKTVEKREKPVKMTIWDTPDYSKYQPIVEHNCENSDAIVFVYQQNSAEIEEIKEMISEIAELVRDKGKILVALQNVKSKQYKAAGTDQPEVPKDLFEKYSIKPMKINASVRDRVRNFFDQLLDLLMDQQEKLNAVEPGSPCHSMKEYQNEEEFEGKKENNMDKTICEEETELLNADLEEVEAFEWAQQTVRSLPRRTANLVPDSELRKGNKENKDKNILVVETKERNAVGCCSNNSAMCNIF